MNRSVFCRLILFLFPLLSFAADPKWIHMENENFRVFSSANERDTRDTVKYLERVRSFFYQASGSAPRNPVPIYVVIFGSAKEYEPFKPKEFAAAYYSSGTDRDYIVMGKVEDEASRVAAHEYTHLVFRHAGYTLPPWLNEGIADLFSTLQPASGGLEFGNVLMGRLYGLAQNSWVPLQTILSADADSPYYTNSKQAGILYNESWALVHMLNTWDEYRPNFWDVVNLIQDGTPSVTALERVYQMPLAKIENDLKLYVHGNSFRKLITKLKVADMESLKGTPANLFDVRVLQADLLANHRESMSEARSRYLELTKEDASRPEPWSGLGYLAWRENKQDEAAANFGHAYDAGDRNGRLLYDYARMIVRTDAPRATKVLDDFVKLEPKNFDARMLLASLQSSQQQYAAALATLKGITSVRAERDRALMLRADVAMRAGDRAESRARAEELKRNSKDEQILSRVDSLLRYLDQLDRGPVSAGPRIIAPDNPELDRRPALQSREVATGEQETRPATRADMEIILQDVRGSLVEMNCTAPARLILQTDGGLKSYVVLQPDRLIVTGSATGNAEFACGKQAKPAKLRLQFTIAPEGSDVDGVARALHFEP